MIYFTGLFLGSKINRGVPMIVSPGDPLQNATAILISTSMSAKY
jgi:hypothetical protein